MSRRISSFPEKPTPTPNADARARSMNTLRCSRPIRFIAAAVNSSICLHVSSRSSEMR